MRRLAYRPRAYRPPAERIRMRSFANQTQSTAREIGRDLNELNGLEARMRGELSQRQRSKMMKKAEKMAQGVASIDEVEAQEDIARAKEAAEATDATDRNTVYGMRFGQTEASPLSAGIDAKVARRSAKLKKTGDNEAAAEAYRKFDDAERQFYDELPQERVADAEVTRADRSTKEQRVPGNFEGDMAPIEGMHDEAEELAGHRGPGLRDMSEQAMKPEGPRSASEHKDVHQAWSQPNMQRFNSETESVEFRERRLADQAEQESKEEIAAFKDMAHTAAEKMREGATALKEAVMPKVVAGASIIKEKFEHDVLPKAKESAAQLRHKVTDEWAPKLKEKVTEEWAPKAAEKTKEAASQLRHKVTDEWAPKAAEKTKEAAARMSEKMKENAPHLKEKMQETATAAKEKAKDAASRTYEKVKQSAPNVAEKASDAAEYAKEKASEAAEYAKEKASNASEKLKDSAAEARERMAAQGDYVRSSSWNLKENVKENVEYAKDTAVDTAKAAKEKIKEKASAARESMSGAESLQEAASQLKNKATSAMHTLKEKAGEAMEKAEDKLEEMKERPTTEGTAATDTSTLLSDAASRAAQTTASVGSRVWEKAKEAGEVVAEKVKEKTKDAAHRIAEETRAHPEEWVGKEKLSEVRRSADAESEEWTNLKASATSMAGTMKEKVRAGVNAAANKVEEALSKDDKEAARRETRQRGNTFDLRAENLRVEETAADALEREAAAAKWEKKERESEKSKEKRRDALAGTLKDKAEHDATVDMEEKYKKEAYQRPQQRKPVRRSEMRA